MSIKRNQTILFSVTYGLHYIDTAPLPSTITIFILIVLGTLFDVNLVRRAQILYVYARLALYQSVDRSFRLYREKTLLPWLEQCS